MAYLGDKLVQPQLVLGEALVEGAQLGQGIPQRRLFRPQLGHGQLELHAASLSLQGWDQGGQRHSGEERRGEKGRDGKRLRMVYRCGETGAMGRKAERWGEAGGQGKTRRGRERQDPQRRGRGTRQTRDRTITVEGLLPTELLERSRTPQRCAGQGQRSEGPPEWGLGVALLWAQTTERGTGIHQGLCPQLSQTLGPMSRDQTRPELQTLSQEHQEKLG